ncbi:MAG: hypothetical protein HY226_03850, partial [Candidatus Vogelbacteria bacterium]|nr:hypothetical protein [Candidatus Vogelbacteria bacterium]
MPHDLTNTLAHYQFTDGEVYYVKSQEDDTVILAMDPKIQGSDLVWFDTVKERIKPI